MSPSKQKSNERQAAREQKSSARQAASGGLGASAYNPSSGTFHTLEPSNLDTETSYLNGRFKSIDDTDDNASSHGGGVDVDSMSNNGSCSGESEDQLHTSGKEKNVPGKTTTNKRDKIRGKNERKHQRQKERRAQELKDKCTGYLMSRKLEGLSQKLVAMGFLQERATMALIANEGHVERSVAWLLEGGEGQVHEGLNSSGNLKIDISEELDLLLEMGKKYNIPRPDIERAVVSCEGDLDKALGCLRAHGVSPVSEEDHKVESRILDAGQSASLPVRSDSSLAFQTRSSFTGQPSHQSRMFGSSSEGRLQSDTSVSTEGSSKCTVRLQPSSLQSLIAGVERGGMVQLAPAKTVPLVPAFPSISSAEAGLVFGFGAPNPMQLFPGSVNDQVKNGPVSKGQAWSLSQMKSQPMVAPQSIPIPSSPFSTCSWSPKGLIEGGSPSSVLHVNDDMRMKGLGLLPSVKHSLEGLELGAHDFPDQISSFLTSQVESQASPWNGLARGLTYDITSHPLPLPATHSGSPSGTSYGLFTGWGAGIPRSSIDWSTGPIQNYDYRTIDWSMNVSPTPAQGISSHLNSLATQRKSSYGWSFEGERRVQTGFRAAAFSTESNIGNGSWKVGPPGAGTHDKISMELRNPSSYEWTSPFAGKALFNPPQPVSSTFF